MSGHSKWAQTKHKKAITDSKRSKIFSKLAAAITVAAREGGGEANQNPRLRDAIAKARDFNMPQDGIERATNRGTGAGGGTELEEVHYGVYGPGGVALIVRAITENKNRTLNELRHLLSEHHSKLVDFASVKWLFVEKDREFVPASSVVVHDPEAKKRLEELFIVLDDHADVDEIYSNALLE
ncbi:MAG: YebC/PmpR family DNA-binding transcriptional regulator [Parcubacteria group bacterium]|nr:YebC/PmpR family DNA-binding transcriptional regulator [Parcubacteria group bacterium]